MPDLTAYGTIYRSTSFNIGAVNTWTDVPLDSGELNLLNISHDDSTNAERVEVDIAGKYSITYSVSGRRQASIHHLVSRLYKNGSSEVEGSWAQDCCVSGDANEIHACGNTVIVDLSAGDYITIQAGMSVDVANELDYYDDANCPDPITFVTATITLIRLGS